MILDRKRFTVFILSLAIFMDVLDSNIINTAIPSIANSLYVHPIDLKIALISYLLSLAIFIPISGFMADKYGTKNIFVLALAIFTISSFWCGYAKTLFELVLGRSIQGIGGAFMISMPRLIIARTFKRHQLVSALNTMTIVIATAIMIGPFVGGVVTEHFSWPWIFWLNIPVGIMEIILTILFVKDLSSRKVIPFDLLGFILFGSAVAVLCAALSLFSESNINHQMAYSMLIFAIFMFIFYFFHAKRLAHPVIKIKLFSIRTFQISVFGNLCARLGFGGMPFLLPLMQQIGLGFSAELSGLLLVPMAFGIIFSKMLTFQILKSIGYRRYLITNTIIVAIVLWLFLIIDIHTSIYSIALLTFIFGIVIAAQYTGMNSLAFAEIAENELSAATSITTTTQILAQSFGVAVSAILLRYYSSPHHLLTISIFHQTFFAMGILTFISATVFMRLSNEDGRQLLRVSEN